MSALTDRIAAEHMPTTTSACTCDGMKLGEYYPRHLIKVTEDAVRKQVAQEIRAQRDRRFRLSDLEKVAYDTAARIADGATP